MMNHAPLKRVARLTAGQSPPSEDIGPLEGEYPFLQGNAEFGVTYPSAQHACRNAPKRCQPGDILVSVRAPVGALNVADREYGIGRGLCAISSSNIEPRYLWWHLHKSVEYLKSMAVGSTYDAVTSSDIGSLPIWVPPVQTQIAIADRLDAETARIDTLINKKRQMVKLLEEKVECLIRQRIACSTLVDPNASKTTTTIRKALTRLDRPPVAGRDMITAFRDGQVTARSLRRADGYTQSWTAASRVQGVRKGDVVIHGLDGFAGAIGTAEVDGVCSPVYHVCSPVGNGDADYLGRMLRILAADEYLGLFASSTRERAVDFRNWDLFGRIPIPQVDPAEQLEIGDTIRRISPLKLAVERSVELAQERRIALITAAYTGEIEYQGASK